MQVSERVLGFIEMRGRNKAQHEYGPNSEYYHSPINRFFQTTGVCWDFSERSVVAETLAPAVLEAFCQVCGMQERDLGIGSFFSKESPVGSGPCQGMCIYDATNGSLRLTQKLAERITEILEAAVQNADRDGDLALCRELQSLAKMILRLEPASCSVASVLPDMQEDWAFVIAPREKAIYTNEDGPHEVEVVQFRFTPHGPMYELTSSKPGTWMVSASSVQPIHGRTQIIRLNLVTGETQQLSASAGDSSSGLKASAEA
jgi:hypothetical protein